MASQLTGDEPRGHKSRGVGAGRGSHGRRPSFLHEVNPQNPAEDSPDRIGISSTRIELFVEAPDAVIERATAAGATGGSELVEHRMPWGRHRQGGFCDPFGHNWSVGDRSPLIGRSH